MINEFPILSNSVSFGPKIINPNYESLIEFIQKNEKNGLDHLVLDEKVIERYF